MQIFFLYGLWRLLKNAYLPVQLHSRASRDIVKLGVNTKTSEYIEQKIKRAT